jgi:hypothetical protein
MTRLLQGMGVGNAAPTSVFGGRRARTVRGVVEAPPKRLIKLQILSIKYHIVMIYTIHTRVAFPVERAKWTWIPQPKSHNRINALESRAFIRLWRFMSSSGI